MEDKIEKKELENRKEKGEGGMERGNLRTERKDDYEGPRGIELESLCLLRVGHRGWCLSKMYWR